MLSIHIEIRRGTASPQTVKAIFNRDYCSRGRESNLLPQTISHRLHLILFLCLLSVSSVIRVFALDSSEVAILVNKNSADSVKLGEYYAEKRGVPKNQILALDLPMDEDLARSRYAEYVVPTVRQWLTDNKLQNRIRCIVTTYGIPLRVNRRIPTEHDKALLGEAARALDVSLAHISELTKLVSSIPQALPPHPNFLLEQNIEPIQGATPDKLLRELSSAMTNAQERIRDLTGESDRRTALQLLSEFRRVLEVAPRSMDRKEHLVKSEELATLDKLLSTKSATLDEQRRWIALNFELRGLAYFCRLMEIRCKDLAGADSEAAFDSELSLLWWDGYPLYRWADNLLTPSFDSDPRRKSRKTLMVSRLDAPTPALARRLVDDALTAESTGLTGNIYIDARGLGETPPRDLYGEFDEHLRQTARFFQDKSTLKVVLDNKPALFQRGDCPDAALYCGWYSLSKYVDAFKWQRGAVAYHVASGEAYTLRRRDSQVWCKRMIEEGVAATLGPVAEPYLGAFPPPRDFFALLMTGKWTLAECYYRTVPWHSWMMTLVGDPLYRPFAKNPTLKVEDLPRGLAIPDGWAK
jgi:uncharacterized protein (TIGR03790 family)